MGPAMSETPLRLGWTPTEALADQVSGEPGPGEVGTPIGQLIRRRDQIMAATSDITWVLRPFFRCLWTTRRRLQSDWASYFGSTIIRAPMPGPLLESSSMTTFRSSRPRAGSNEGMKTRDGVGCCKAASV